MSNPFNIVNLLQTYIYEKKIMLCKIKNEH